MSAKLSTGLHLDALGERIRQERKRRSFSLEQLSRAARVSTSMLSAVERGEKIPSVLVLDQIATGLKTSIARLLADEQVGREILLRREEQNVAADPAGWERRVLSRCCPTWSSSSCGPRSDRVSMPERFCRTIPDRENMSPSSVAR